MGVLGLSDVGGVGVYGITGSVLVPPSTVNLGIGVVGRALDGVALEENESMEEILGVPPGVDPQGSVGVFGTSNSGVGVRAHAGPLLEGADGGPGQGPAGPGAIFSAGLVAQVPAEGVDNSPRLGALEIVSLAAFPQLRLIPGVGNQLPSIGHLGDLYAMAVVEEPGSVVTVGCRLFLCVQAGTGTAGSSTGWAEVLQGEPVVVNSFGP
jgi:hypothetical protein